MAMTTFGYQTRQYKEQVRRWANRLGAEDITIHADHSVTLLSEEGYICCRYNPKPCELQKGE